MIPQDQLAALLEEALDTASREAIEAAVASDAEALRFILEQRKTDRVLHSLLGAPARRQQLRQSILAAVAGASTEDLRAQVMAHISGRHDLPAVPATQPTRATSPASISTHAAGGRAGLAHIVWTRIEALRRELSASLTGRLATAAAVVLLGFAAWVMVVGQKPAPGPEIGSLAEVIGAPVIRRAAEPASEEASLGTRVRLGDRLETGDADRAEIRFRDGTTLRLEFNTVVEIPTANSEPRTPGLPLLRPPEIHLLRGQMWTRVQKATNAPRYAVRTPVATAVARGTEFGLKVGKRASTGPEAVGAGTDTNLVAVLTVKEGAVDFFNAFGSVQATAMTESTAAADSAPTEARRLVALRALPTGNPSSWSILTSPLSGSEAAEKLVPGGGWSGLTVRGFAEANPAPTASSGVTASEVRVTRVKRASPAELAGIRIGDVILSVNGQPVTSAGQIDNDILIRPGAGTRLGLRRGAEETTVTVTALQRASVLPGPNLLPRERTMLADVTRRFVAEQGGRQPQTLLPLHEKPLRAAAENNLGVILESEDALGPAIRAYGRAVRADSQVPLYRLNLGLALRKIGSYERAEEELDVALRLAPRSIHARLRFAEIQSLLGRDSAAVALTDAALQDDPGSHGLWELKAQLLWKAQRLDEAREAALKAVELEPDCVVAHSYLGGVLEDQKRFEAAEEAYREAAALDPFEASLHFSLGTVRQARGQMALAEESFRKATELRADDANSHASMGLVLEALGRFDEAETSYREAIKLNPKDPASYHNLAEMFRKQRRQLDEAASLYRKAIQLDPGSAGSYSGLGLILSRRGDLLEAERLLRQACDLDPGASSMHNNLGEVLRRAGRYDEAADCYRKALDLDPNNLGASSNLGIVHAVRREFGEAEKAFRAVLVRSSGLARHAPLVNLGNVCGQQGKVRDAEGFFREALALQPEDPQTCAAFASFLADHHLELDEALSLARLAVRASPNDPGHLDTLGWVHAHRGEWGEAENSLKKALDLAGRNPPADEILEHMKKVQQKKTTAE